jgi:hypothetical protein
VTRFGNKLSTHSKGQLFIDYCQIFVRDLMIFPNRHLGGKMYRFVECFAPYLFTGRYQTRMWLCLEYVIDPDTWEKGNLMRVLPHPRAFASDFGIYYDPRLWIHVPGYLPTAFLSQILRFVWGPLLSTTCCSRSLSEKALHGCCFVQHSEGGLSSKQLWLP